MEEDRERVTADAGQAPSTGARGLLSWPDRQPALALGSSLIVALAVGYGAFLFGESTGADLDRAEQQGRTAGMTKGAKDGGSRGYLAGFSKAKKKAYGKAYERSYRRSYAKAYAEAGLDKPSLPSIEVSW